MCLIATGREVARRRGDKDLNLSGVDALHQMRELSLLPGAVTQVDVNAASSVVEHKIERFLNNSIFRVQPVAV